ncbi:YoaK family protein [Conexibacter sp. CPCC 206217]|uniref:YoaK family protein n=1 Tax=Conexibacter sp. CPCC 206217 TaxID=3064574 RepID=UPI0027252445|nr:YoaK family protein [Conexibacter sp. CPCC 206217]MDO8210660.1 YoaK family protein [Conexibacter sp. CPCC 206217]
MRGLGLDGRGRRLLALTCATGMIDAVAFLGLGQVFCAMQTGNVVFLGLGIAGTDGAPFAAPLTALCAFVAGGVAAALLLRAGAGAVTGAARGVRAAVAAEILLLVLATAVAAGFDPRAGETAALLTIAALAGAMGLRTTVVRGRGAANLATTVLNLTAIGGPASAGVTVASGADLAQRAAALVALLVGAVAGALSLETALWLPLALATALTLATHALDRSRRPGGRPTTLA